MSGSSQTRKLILKVGNSDNLHNVLSSAEIENLSCKHLQDIDRLWAQYSNGKFGLSVQKKIYQRLGGMREYEDKSWLDFLHEVGWHRDGNPLSYNDLTFDLEAREGHLPAECFWDTKVCQSAPEGKQFFFSRLIRCSV